MLRVPPPVSEASLTTLSTIILVLEQLVLLVLAITALVLVQVPLLVPVSVLALALSDLLEKKLSADNTLAVELRMP